MKSTNGLIGLALLSLVVGMPGHAFAGTQCKVVGSYVIDVEYLGVNYSEELVLTGTNNALTGTLELVGGGSPWTFDSGSVVGETIEFDGSYDPNPGLRVHFSGDIADDGSISGTWEDTTLDSRNGTWATTSGLASCRDEDDHHRDRDKDEHHHDKDEHNHDRDNDDRRR
jgi:hypothetical protein